MMLSPCLMTRITLIWWVHSIVWRLVFPGRRALGRGCCWRITRRGCPRLGKRGLKVRKFLTGRIREDRLQGDAVEQKPKGGSNCKDKRRYFWGWWCDC